ncbi:hypothetical protein D9M68_727210 [compost metagenome]
MVRVSDGVTVFSRSAPLRESSQVATWLIAGSDQGAFISTSNTSTSQSRAPMAYSGTPVAMSYCTLPTRMRFMPGATSMGTSLRLFGQSIADGLAK